MWIFAGAKTASAQQTRTDSSFDGNRSFEHLFSSAAEVHLGLFLLAKLLSVHYAPVSERAKACKEAKGNRKQKNRTKNHKQQNPNKKPNTTNTKIPLLQVRPVRQKFTLDRVMRSSRTWLKFKPKLKSELVSGERRPAEPGGVGPQASTAFAKRAPKSPR